MEHRLVQESRAAVLLLLIEHADPTRTLLSQPLGSIILITEMYPPVEK